MISVLTDPLDSIQKKMDSSLSKSFITPRAEECYDVKMNTFCAEEYIIQMYVASIVMQTVCRSFLRTYRYVANTEEEVCDRSYRIVQKNIQMQQILMHTVCRSLVASCAEECLEGEVSFNSHYSQPLFIHIYNLSFRVSSCQKNARNTSSLKSYT